MSILPSVFVTCAAVFIAEALKLPDYIAPCSKQDPKFNECAIRNGQKAIPRLIKGDPKYGVPVLDPFFISELVIKESGITISAHEFTIEGAKDAILKEFSVDFDKLTISLQFLMPLVVFRGTYEMSGKLVSLPISGKGSFNATYEDLTVKYSTICNFTEKDGKMYLKPHDYELNLDPRNAKLYFGNLFNGNKQIGDATNDFINENWRLVLREVGKPAFKALGLVIHTILTEVAQKVPYDELFSDTD